MKKFALTGLVLALGLAACESKTADAVENTEVANAIEADVFGAVQRVFRYSSSAAFSGAERLTP